jgi:hypothetical protein
MFSSVQPGGATVTGQVPGLFVASDVERGVVCANHVSAYASDVLVLAVDIERLASRMR